MKLPGSNSKKTKYLLYLLLVSVFITILAFFPSNSQQLANADTEKKIEVILDGEALIFSDQEPTIIKDRVMIPARVLAETWGIGIDWDSKKRRIDLNYLENHLRFDINNDEVLINGNKVDMNTAMIIREGRILIPLRLVSEAFGAEVSWDSENRRVIIDTKRGFKIIDIEKAQGVYQTGDIIKSKITLKNITDEKQSLWVGYSLQDPLGKYYDIPAQALDLESGEQDTVAISWQITENSDLVSGEYNSFLAVWDQKPVFSKKSQAKKLADFASSGDIVIFREIDHFEDLDNKSWVVSSHSIGKGDFLPANVQLENNRLKIILPGECLSSGEIRSQELMKYGRYEIRLKAPDVPSTITGFFLYKAPDYYREIDIELYRGEENEIYFVLYAGGEKTNEVVKKLEFDPARDFHTYTIDFFPGEVSFYVDREKMASFTKGLPRQSMYLMVNAWYPDWLEEAASPGAGSLEIDWIAY
jgi:hypothetical protein